MATKKTSKKKVASKEEHVPPAPVANPIRSKLIDIVAIGASAGGLEPIESFFNAMPTDSGNAFVIIQHLSPNFRSLMDELLSRKSNMKIMHAENGAHIEPDTIYLNSPRTNLTVAGNNLYLVEANEEESPALPINTFFTSLSKARNERAIGIIMSGTGTDGTLGSERIQDVGGAVLAQDPYTCKFDSMPRSVIELNFSKAIAKPEEMPDIISEIRDGTFDAHIVRHPEKRIIQLLNREFGADFNLYKLKTINRRIERRAQLAGNLSVEEYAIHVEENKPELENLYFDILIQVTSFFRDQDAFDFLETVLLTEVFPLMTEHNQLRLWSAACSSGEEAYTLGMIVSEYARINGLPLNAKIFATDINFKALEHAANGVYSVENLAKLPKNLVEMYFSPVGNSYRVKHHLRKMIVFSSHDLIKDPPFTKMDLVTCRNMLIYLGESAQSKVLSMLMFALKKDGTLFLGPSESVSPLQNEFTTISEKWNIFRKNSNAKVPSFVRLTDDVDGLGSGKREQKSYLGETFRRRDLPVNSVAEKRESLVKTYENIIDQYVGDAILVSSSNDLEFIFGDAAKYLAMSQKQFSSKIIDLILADLSLVLAAGLERSRTKNIHFKRNVVLNAGEDVEKTVLLGVKKIKFDSSSNEHSLVTFEELDQTPIEQLVEVAQESDVNFFTSRIESLQDDLKVTEESLQGTIEEMETSNEELQATNEELMASNEELQSTNEELHSVNEELFTVSSEHQRKIDELSMLSDDMDNLLKITDVGIIFVDHDLCIQRFTPAIKKAFNIADHDIARPLDHISKRFTQEGLLLDVERVLKEGGQIEHRIHADNVPYLLKILPYESSLNSAKGVVIAIYDAPSDTDKKV